MNLGGSSLIGKIGQGNFNHRITGLGLNVVATAPHDCAGQPSSCYGNAYVEYDLEHEAFNVPLENYDRGITCFNFGLAAIRSGKALAAERVLTLPLGGSDRESFSGPPFLKTELSGRPISGSYRLRIKESPGLDWSSIEDVQLLLNYRYWSRVQANSAQ